METNYSEYLTKQGSLKSFLTYGGKGQSNTVTLKRSQDSVTMASPRVLFTQNRLRKLRVVLYSHDTLGLGHLRRNLLIARSLVNSDLDANVLLINGTNVSTSFSMPRGVDCLSLPGLAKTDDGRYKSRSLALGLHEIVAIRERTILTAIDSYEPDIMIVDNVPRGTNRELDSCLRHLKKKGQTQLILGLRDILDAPSTVQREWQRKRNEKTIIDYYDAVWVYGDPNIYDLVQEYKLSQEIQKKIRFTGYLDRTDSYDPEELKSLTQSPEKNALPPGKFILCMAGGGQDGTRLLETFAQAKLPADTYGVILTGPFLPERTKRILYTQAGLNPQLKILEFHPEPLMLLKEAESVVAMGGYNTFSEILSFEKRALIVPRVVPRQEQLIRAECFEKLGMVDIFHPDKLDVNALSGWLNAPRPARVAVRERIDMTGLERIPGFVKEMLVP